MKPWPEVRFPVKPLRSLYDVQLGKMLEPEPTEGTSEAPYLNAGRVRWEGAEATELPTMFATDLEREHFGVRAGDLVVLEGGEAGRAGFVGDVPSGTIIQNSLHRVRGDALALRWLWYCMQSMSGAGWFDVICNAATIRHLTGDKLGRLPIPTPPSSEQQRIVEFLDAETSRIDELVAEQVDVDRLLEEARRAAVFEYVSGATAPGKRRPGPLWSPSIPERWSLVKLTTVARLGSGHTPARNRPDLWEDCTIPWITTGEVWQIRSDVQETITETREKISRAGIAESAAVVHPAGTVVLCRTAASAGYSAIMGLDMATSQDFATWTCGPDLLPDYLLYCLRAMRRDLLERLAMGSTHRTIYMPDIKSIAIPLPPLDEQQTLVAELRKRLAVIDATREELDAQIALLREHRQALITAAVTGGLDAVKKVA